MVWVGLEYARAYVITGFSLAMLSQSQQPFPILLQTADIFVAYGPSFFMMVSAAALTLVIARAGRTERLVSLSVAFALVLAALVYGSFRMQQPTAEGPTLRVMLVQGSVDTKFDGTDRRPQMRDHYRDLTFDHLEEHPPCDLVVWPESSWIYPQVQVADPENLPPQLSADEYRASQEGMADVLKHYAEMLNRREPGKTHFVVGGNTFYYDEAGEKLHNAALFISPEGKLADRYFKTHLVMCGEYIPGGEWFPFIYGYTPIQPLSPGHKFRAFQVAGLNVCAHDLLREHCAATVRSPMQRSRSPGTRARRAPQPH